MKTNIQYRRLFLHVSNSTFDVGRSMFDVHSFSCIAKGPQQRAQDFISLHPNRLCLTVYSLTTQWVKSSSIQSNWLKCLFNGNPKEQIPPPTLWCQLSQRFEFELFAPLDAGGHRYIDETFLKAPGDIHEFSGAQACFKR
jgi:hypothetical protein